MLRERRHSEASGVGVLLRAGIDRASQIYLGEQARRGNLNIPGYIDHDSESR